MLLGSLANYMLSCYQLPHFILQVKADVQNVSGELIVSGLDSATSLIQVTTISVEIEILSSPHSGSEELDERSGVDGEGVLCSKHQVQEAGD